MGRSSRADMEENRHKIVRAAADLFRIQGVNAVSIADIMRAAGMTQGGFYKHFPTKDALAAEACLSAFANAALAWRDKADQAVQAGSSGLDALVEYYLSPKSPEKTCPMVALGRDASDRESGELLSEAYRNGVKLLFDTFNGVAMEAVSPPSPAQLTMLFTSMLGTNYLAQTVGTEDLVKQMQASLCSTTTLMTSTAH